MRLDAPDAGPAGGGDRLLGELEEAAGERELLLLLVGPELMGGRDVQLVELVAAKGARCRLCSRLWGHLEGT